MKAVKVQYTVQPEYVETNKKNIGRVMVELRALNSPDVKYSAFLLDDGKTFVHFVMRNNEQNEDILQSLDVFQDFQKQLRESKPESPPKVENLTLVDAGWEIF